MPLPYRLLLVSACLVLAACTSSRPSVVSPEQARQELMVADRAFDVDTAERGIDGWMAHMSVDAARLPRIGGDTIIQGTAEVREADTQLFANPSRKLRWSPATSAVFDDGQHGLTTGRWRYIEHQSDGTEAILGTGSYLTWWRRGTDGAWQVIFDTGTSDSPDTASQ